VNTLLLLCDDEIFVLYRSSPRFGVESDNSVEENQSLSESSTTSGILENYSKRHSGQLGASRPSAWAGDLTAQRSLKSQSDEFALIVYQDTLAKQS
jgi:hypothetical protein